MKTLMSITAVIAATLGFLLSQPAAMLPSPRICPKTGLRMGLRMGLKTGLSAAVAVWRSSSWLFSWF